MHSLLQAIIILLLFCNMFFLHSFPSSWPSLSWGVVSAHMLTAVSIVVNKQRKMMPFYFWFLCGRQGGHCTCPKPWSPCSCSWNMTHFSWAPNIHHAWEYHLSLSGLLGGTQCTSHPILTTLLQPPRPPPGIPESSFLPISRQLSPTSCLSLFPVSLHQSYYSWNGIVIPSSLCCSTVIEALRT